MMAQPHMILTGRFLTRSAFVLGLVLVLAGTSRISAQEKRQKTVRTVGSNLEISEYTLLPDATEPCTPEECEWWNRIRNAGNGLYKKSDEKARTRFYLLLLEGLQKAHRVPLKDAPAHALIGGRVSYPERSRKMGIQGTVVLSVEFKADASIGEIEIVSGLNSELNESAIAAARQNVFLPAVKDGSFVTTRSEMKYGFTLGRVHSRKK